MESAINNWSLEYLSSHLADQILQMFVTPNRQFRSYSQDNRGHYVIDPTHTTHNGTFETFLEVANALDNATNNSRVYFEQIVSNSSLPSNLQDHLSAFINWVKTELLPVAGWGEFQFQQSLLSVGMRDTTIPAHYNTEDNLFAIVRYIGCLYRWKRVSRVIFFRFLVTRSLCCSVLLSTPIYIHSQCIIHKTDSHRYMYCFSVSLSVYLPSAICRSTRLVHYSQMSYPLGEFRWS